MVNFGRVGKLKICGLNLQFCRKIQIDIIYSLWDIRIDLNQGRGTMKKVFVVSLLLVSIFLIGNAEVALAQCDLLQDYRCTVTRTQYGVVDSIFPDCVQLCYDGFDVYFYDPFCFYCYLYPVGLKSLVGTANTLWGQAGCFVKTKGKKLIAQKYSASCS